MKKTLIALMALAGVAMAADQSNTLVIDYSQAPKYVVDDATLYNYLDNTFNKRGELTFALTLNYNGESVGYYQTILHIGGADRGLTLGLNGSTHLMFGESKLNEWGFRDDHELTAAGLIKGDNSVVYTLKFKTEGVAAASITLNGTEYAMNDMLWSEINLSSSNSETRYDEYTLGYRGPGWDGNNVMTTVGTKSMTVTYTIPEPATATLSLLALAGLCARRRRA